MVCGHVRLRKPVLQGLKQLQERQGVGLVVEFGFVEEDALEEERVGHAGHVARELAQARREGREVRDHDAFLLGPGTVYLERMGNEGRPSPAAADARANEILAERRSQPGLLTDVRAAILRSIREGNPSLATVAALLNEAPQTLQRRLADGGASFRRELDGDIRTHKAKSLPKRLIIRALHAWYRKVENNLDMRFGLSVIVTATKAA